jgi:hypothetical protein
MTTTPAHAETLPATPPGEPLGSALARLEARWGSAAVRLGSGGRIDASTAISQVGAIGLRALASAAPTSEANLTLGALALAPLPNIDPALAPTPSPDHHSAPGPATEVVSTGFPTLDALLGTGGLPRRAVATLRGDASSGKTTLALRAVAQAQAAGGIVAWLDGGRTFDPLEAAARGVEVPWVANRRSVAQIAAARTRTDTSPAVASGSCTSSVATCRGPSIRTALIPGACHGARPPRGVT